MSSAITNQMAPTKRFSSLQRKILSLFALLLMVVSGVVALTTLRAAYFHSSEQLQANFVTSKQVFSYKLINDGNVLKGHLQNAAKDFNTKQLIADGRNDPESLASVIGNQQRRAKADFALVLDKNIQPLFSSLPNLPSFQPQQFSNGDISFLSTPTSVYLVKAVAVKFLEKQPNADAWLIMGLDITNLIDEQVKSLTGFDLTVINANQQVASTKGVIQATALEKFKTLQPDLAQTLMLNAKETIAFRFSPNAQQSDISFIFTIDNQMAHLNFNQLSGQLFIVMCVVIILAFIGSFYISKGITQPLRALARVAKSIQIGNYAEKLPQATSSEVYDLSSAFNAMREGINQREQKIERLAYYNDLTSLPNRNAFKNAVSQLIEQSPNQSSAIILLNLARFKDVNDTLGHEFGDKVLVNVANRLKHVSFNNAFISHMSGDEFAILLSELPDNETENVIAQIPQLFERPFEIENIILDIDASFGVSIYPQHSNTAVGLLQMADIALHKSKHSHQPFVLYDNSFDTHSVQRLSLMSELRHAIQHDQLTLFYQPKLCLKTNTVISVECLVRWIHPEHGFIGPDDFIPLAEQSGAIRDLTKWAINTAIQQHCDWRDNKITLKMAVNISALDLVDMSLPAYVSEQLRKYNIEADYLCLEVTESAVMSDPEQAIQALDMLTRMGIKLSIDDFGTGFSSMTQLKNMPVKELKIDKSFVLELANNKDDAKIVKSTADLAHNLGLSVVAEGVEDAEALEILRANNVEFAQGYYIAKPMPSDALTSWFSEAEYAHA